jgi:integrase
VSGSSGRWYLATVDGLRWGEVAGLRVRQLDFEDGTVAISETIVRGRRGEVEVGRPKSDASRRTLAVPAELMAMLVRHMAAKGLTVEDRGELLFTAPGGGMLRYSNWLRRQWYPAAVAAGAGALVEDERTGRKRHEGLGFHDLRRANATGLVAAGVDVKTAQSVLGHTDARVTLELYAQVVTEQQRAAADAMGAKFLGESPRGNRGAEAETGDEGNDAENGEEAP